MRIIAGEFRGHRLSSLGKGDVAARLRPTPDRVRESLFSLLSARIDWEELRILDLFSGTGALGLEAISRGASFCSFVDSGRVSQRLIEDNINRLGLRPRTELLRRDATRLGRADAPCDLIFLDPPYGTELGARALQSAMAGGWVAPNALVVWEDDAAHKVADGLSPIEQRRYGQTWINLFDVSAPA